MLVSQDSNGTGTFLYSKEGITQGNPLSMFAYRVGILPLICTLKQDFSELEQPWNVDYAGVAGKFDNSCHHFCKLKEIGPEYGYFPEFTKSILIVPEHNLERAKIAFDGLGFKITTPGGCYLGGFIGEEAEFKAWIEEETRNWVEEVGKLALAAKNFPQAAYSGLQKHCSRNGSFYSEFKRILEKSLLRWRGQYLKSSSPLFSTTSLMMMTQDVNLSASL
jgi:hypothetical protein